MYRFIKPVVEFFACCVLTIVVLLIGMYEAAADHTRH